MDPLITLDLHGVGYDEALRRVNAILGKDWSRKPTICDIVTGHGVLQKPVKELVQRMGFRHGHEPLNNPGCLRVYLE
ncbi:MAG: Smr/MutS family protein [Planctomycetota bacterium]